MKKKIAGRIGAAILAASLMMSMAVPAMAESNYTAIAVSTNPTFEKYLIMDQGDTTPNLSFSFTIGILLIHLYERCISPPACKAQVAVFHY